MATTIDLGAPNASHTVNKKEQALKDKKIKEAIRMLAQAVRKPQFVDVRDVTFFVCPVSGKLCEGFFQLPLGKPGKSLMQGGFESFDAGFLWMSEKLGDDPSCPKSDVLETVVARAKELGLVKTTTDPNNIWNEDNYPLVMVEPKDTLGSFKEPKPKRARININSNRKVGLEKYLVYNSSNGGTDWELLQLSSDQDSFVGDCLLNCKVMYTRKEYSKDV